MHDINKITIISDTHGIIDQKIVPYLKKTDMIIHAGDIMDTKIINQLNSYCDNVVLVAGNNDGGPCFMEIQIDNNNWEIQPYCIK